MSLSTSQLAATAGYSVQQVRDLERLGVLPPSVRRSNNYREFSTIHVAALCAYQQLARAVGPVEARQTMIQLQVLPRDQALASINAQHLTLAQGREQALIALDALGFVLNESAQSVASVPSDSMTISELSAALAVRSSTLRFWEQEQLLTPDRVSLRGARLYSPEVITVSRVIAALRAGGYSIPAIRDVISSLDTRAGMHNAEIALRARLDLIADQTEALLRAGDALAKLVAVYAEERPADL